MGSDRAFVDFVSDQLRAVPDVRSRAMFGGFGLYCGDKFFAIVYEGRLYFKTDRRTRPKYERSGAKHFEPRPGQALGNYFEVPVDVLENDDELVAWAREAAQLGSIAATPRATRPRVSRRR